MPQGFTHSITATETFSLNLLFCYIIRRDRNGKIEFSNYIHCNIKEIVNLVYLFSLMFYTLELRLPAVKH